MIKDIQAAQNAVDNEVVAAITLAIKMTLSRKEPLRRITFSAVKGSEWNRADRYFRNPNKD